MHQFERAKLKKCRFIGRQLSILVFHYIYLLFILIKDKDIKSITNTEMEHQGQQQQEDDKDFRQLWQSTSSSTDSSLGIPKTNKSVNVSIRRINLWFISFKIYTA